MALKYTEEQLNKEVDGKLVLFNEGEAVAAITEYDEDKETVKPRPKKTKGRSAELVADLPVVPVHHMMSEEELMEEFGQYISKNIEI